jgi:hypothetical protein
MTGHATNEPIDFLVHSRERIAAAADIVWPHIAALEWMDAPKLVSIGGTPGVGERFEAYLDPARAHIAYYVVNAAIEPGVRRTLRIEGLDGVPMGFTTFELIANGAETIVLYDVYIRMALPEGQSRDDSLALAKQGGDEALRQLKALVEA